MNKLFSIIIPTRNRQQYCVEAVISILYELDESCELVIQDNSTDDSLRFSLAALNSPIIKYNYNAKPLSFIDNFEEAITLSTGKYLCVLGDDDSITKDALPIIQWMEENNIESVTSTNVVDFIWPNDQIEKFKTGQLTIPKYNVTAERLNTQDQLVKLLKNGILGYQTFNLPRTYHGIVRRSSLEKVKSLAGKYFGGLTPDIYSTIALACVVQSHIVLDFPFSIAGACPASATVQATAGGHAGKLQEAPHFQNRGVYEWEKSIPKYYSVETIWAETAIKAITDLGFSHLLQYFDQYKLYVTSVYLNKKYIFSLSFSETLKVSKALNVIPIKHIMSLGAKAIELGFRVAAKKIRAEKHEKFQVLNNIFSLQEAKKTLNRKIPEFTSPNSFR